MKRNRKMLVAGAAAATVLAGSGAGVAIAASSAGSHTLKLDSVEQSQKQLSKTRFADADKDMSNGKVIGYDVVAGSYDAKTQSITVDVAAGLKGGIIYIHGTGTFKPNAFTGTVTGGTGQYKGVTGTVKGTAYGKNDNNEHLTVTYH